MTESKQAQQYLTVAEVTEKYRLGPQALYSSRHRGRAPGSLGVRVGRRLLWRESDLERWFDEQVERAMADTVDGS